MSVEYTTTIYAQGVTMISVVEDTIYQIAMDIVDEIEKYSFQMRFILPTKQNKNRILLEMNFS